MTPEYIQQELQKIAAVSIELKKAKEDDNYLCELLNNINAETNESNLAYYEQRKDKPLGGFRYEITKKLTEGEKLSSAVLSEIDEQTLGKYSKNVRDWSNFSKCFTLYYRQFESEFEKFLRAFTNQIKDDIGYPDAKDKIVDYNGARNSGSTDAWIAIYNPSQESHSTARQLFFNILNGELSYGLYYHPKPTSTEIVKVSPEEFQYTQLIDYFKERMQSVINDTKEAAEFSENLKVSQALQKISYKDFLEAAKQISDTDIPTREKIRDYYIEIPELNNKQLPPKYLSRRAYSIATNLDDVSILDEMNSIDARRRIEQLKFGIIKQLDEDETQANKTGDLSTKKTNMSKTALNTILYGPPGTGKTYNTINKAVSIADANFYAKNENNRKELTRRFNELLITNLDKDKPTGQIAFCTFHQSMSYEDFVEGIKPQLASGSNNIYYDIKDGIFKILCRMANDAVQYKEIQQQKAFSLSEQEFQQALFYKMSLGDSNDPADTDIFDYCIQNGCVALGWGDEVNFTGMQQSAIEEALKSKDRGESAARQVNLFINGLKNGNYVIVSNGNTRFRAIGKVTGPYYFEENSPIGYHHFRKTEWLLKDIDQPVTDIYDRNFQQWTLYKLNQQQIKKEFFVNDAINSVSEPTEPPNFVLIVDEINRGNISQVFGELISSIEDNKRTGKSNIEALSITLPYSKKQLTVPDNLYIIGTMNTADRSVEALDTALRRRFTFEEMQPQSTLLESKRLMWSFLWKYKDDLWIDSKFQEKEKLFYSFIGIDQSFESQKKELWYDMEKEGMSEKQIELFNKFSYNGIDLKEMLAVMNFRLEALSSRDHTIGHAWLMDVYSLEDLRNAFKNKIIPLLQEYFYNNYSKIGWVIGEDFFINTQRNKTGFANFSYATDGIEDFEDKIILYFKPSKDWDKDTFIRIYNPS